VAEERGRRPGATRDAVPAAEPGTLSRLLLEVARASDEESASSWRESLKPGDVVGRYQIRREIGRGGFGAVYEAFDPQLGRVVALKALKPGRTRRVFSEEWIQKEAEAVAKLDHPAIVTIHDVGTCPAGAYLVMELLQGETLADRIAKGPLPIDEALRIAEQMAEGLAHAHSRGVLHRDLKPANVFVCADGRVKLLDFGLAHLLGTAGSSGAGTPAYMAPEQSAGADVDERADVFAAATVLAETLEGERPTSGGTASGIPHRLARVVLQGRALEPERRPRDGKAWHDLLAALRRRRHRRRLGVASASIVIVLLSLAAWFLHRESRVRWALQVALPQAARLAEGFRFDEAYALLEESARIVPGDPQLASLWPAVACTYDLDSAPEGALVSVKPYRQPDAPWRELGATPLSDVRLPRGPYRWKVDLHGFESSVVAFGCSGLPGSIEMHRAKAEFPLARPGELPDGMVRVHGGRAGLGDPAFSHVPPVALGDYLIGRTEVTNREYQEFVDAGGYRRREFWLVPFDDGGRQLGWEQALERFRDRTGSPGPAGWSSGHFPPGEEDLPVTGVSWYEAGAYAAFRGASLPSSYQWVRAAGMGLAGEIVRASNFSQRSLAPVGSYAGLGRFGTLDMAGNAKEWVWNESGGRRFLLGGAWNEPDYMFVDHDARSPFARESNFGFRVARDLDDRSSPASRAAIPRATRDFATQRPVPENVARAFLRHYAYDPTPLDVRVESVEERPGAWRKEKVSFTAAYGGERVMAFVFTPLDRAPPYQVVVYYPGSGAVTQRSSDKLDARIVTFGDVVRGGRALIHPIFKSTFERGDGLESERPSATASYRDHVVMWAKDLARTIDFVGTRADMDPHRVALYGYSWGANLGPVLLSAERRLKAGILVGGGLVPAESPPEADPLNFAPLVTQPVLMINGRYDFLLPLETSQLPLFRALGTPVKRHLILDSGHQPPFDLTQREANAWLDQHLGPVR
jgi:eukaryotic-like serine/threonine-protein kinase